MISTKTCFKLLVCSLCWCLRWTESIDNRQGFISPLEIRLVPRSETILIFKPGSAFLNQRSTTNTKSVLAQVLIISTRLKKLITHPCLSKASIQGVTITKTTKKVAIYKEFDRIYNNGINRMVEDMSAFMPQVGGGLLPGVDYSWKLRPKGTFIRL